VYEYITPVEEPQGKRLFDIPKCKQQDNIKTGLNIIDDKGVDRLKLTKNTLELLLLKTAIHVIILVSLEREMS
jgi:hypothetical protein